MTPVEYDISVKDLATFVHRRGDLGGDGGFQRSNRALEGIKDTNESSNLVEAITAPRFQSN